MLADLSIKEFIKITASNSPFPGGGSVAALTAALAAGLCEMVAGLTVGKKGFEAVGEEMRETAARASELRNLFVECIDRDSEAFEGVVAAFKLPRETSKEKLKRSREIQKCLKEAALVPLKVAKCACRTMDLAQNAVLKGNRNALTDGVVGVMTARSSALSALCNVKINLRSIVDKEFVADISAQAERLEAEVLEKERRILSEVHV